MFSAVGTAGQRCTSLRRLIVHESVYDDVAARVASTYARLPIGNPLDGGTLVGPLIDMAALEAMQSALSQALGGSAASAHGRRAGAGKHLSRCRPTCVPPS